MSIENENERYNAHMTGETFDEMNPDPPTCEVCGDELAEYISEPHYKIGELKSTIKMVKDSIRRLSKHATNNEVDSLYVIGWLRSTLSLMD